MHKPMITPDLFVKEILDQWPETIKLFLKYRMACVGCSMSAFDTLAEALEIYNLPENTVLISLNREARLLGGDNGYSIK